MNTGQKRARVQRVETGEFGDRVLGVVHAEVHVAIVAPLVPALGLHHEQRGGLLAAPIPSRFIPRCQRGQQALGEASLRDLECLRHRVDHVRPGQDVALNCESGAAKPACPALATLAGEGRGSPVRVHHADLTRRALRIAIDEPVQSLSRGEVPSQATRGQGAQNTYWQPLESRSPPPRPEPMEPPNRRPGNGTRPPLPTHPRSYRRPRSRTWPRPGAAGGNARDGAARETAPTATMSASGSRAAADAIGFRSVRMGYGSPPRASRHRF